MSEARRADARRMRRDETRTTAGLKRARGPVTPAETGTGFVLATVRSEDVDRVFAVARELGELMAVRLEVADAVERAALALVRRALAFEDLTDGDVLAAVAVRAEAAAWAAVWVRCGFLKPVRGAP